MKFLIFLKNLLILVACLGVTFVLFEFIRNKSLKDDQDNVPVNISFGSWVKSISLIDIFVQNPTVESVIENPIIIEGRAPGYWFFEGRASAYVTNSEGLVLGESFIEALDDWMTTGYVNFNGILPYEEKEITEYGYLVIEKDNPSGDFEFADLVKIKIKFK